MIKLTKLPYCDECKFWISMDREQYENQKYLYTELRCRDYYKCQELAKIFRKGLENND